MRMRPCVMFSCLLAGIGSLAKVECLALAWPAALDMQADSTPSDRDLAPPSPSSSKKASGAGAQLFQQHCAKCHGPDGTGSAGRKSFPDIPDFTLASWQGGRTDAQLLASILKGKGDDMPTFARKMKEEQVRDLVTYVRAFAHTKENGEKKPDADSPSFEEAFGRLQHDMELLRRQSRELSQSTKKNPVAQLFQEQCVKCHPRCLFATED